MSHLFLKALDGHDGYSMRHVLLWAVLLSSSFLRLGENSSYQKLKLIVVSLLEVSALFRHWRGSSRNFNLWGIRPVV